MGKIEIIRWKMQRLMEILFSHQVHILKSPYCNDVKYKLMGKKLFFGRNTLFRDAKYKITGNMIFRQVYVIPIMVLLLINSTF